MVEHNTLTGSSLHVPLGYSPNALTLPAATADAYEIHNDGGEITLTNIGASGSITLQHDDGSTSTAANRFTLTGAANRAIASGESLHLIYDGTSSRWRVVG